MTKQAYDVVRREETIDILKNNVTIYSISIAEKSINLQNLYKQMKISIDDEIYTKQKFKKIEEPKNDVDRIYNNTIDFMDRLLVSVDTKLKSLRERQQESIFD